MNVLSVVISFLEFRTNQEAGQYQDILADEDFEPQIKRTDKGFAVVTSIRTDDKIEEEATLELLRSFIFEGRTPRVGVISDEEIAARRARKVPTELEPLPDKEPSEMSPEKRAYLLRYRQTQAFKDSQQRYQQTSGGKEAQRRYAQSNRGRAHREAYQNSEKGIAARKRFQDRQTEKRQLLKAQRDDEMTDEQIERFREVFKEDPF